MNLKKISLFNEDGDDSPEKQELIGGATTGIANLNENKYTWTSKLYRVLLGNFWIPEKVSMVDDKVSINELTSYEDNAVKNTLSFLIFLDSFQCNNLPNITRYITAPNVANLLKIQEFQEVVHSASYQYVMEAIYPLTTRESIYNKWRDNPVLLKRIKFVASIADEFNTDPSLDNFKKIIVANLLLESLYFYQGFMFFDQLASRNKLVQTSKIIDYIRNDEMTHIGIFVNIIRELFTEDDHPMIIDMFKQAVDHEIEWANHIYGDNILGISKKSSEEYVKYLANDRLKRIGISAIFPEYTTNPYTHLEGTKKENFFESTVTSYDRSESITGWDF